jgi:ADP-ribose pyrophosphatase YjhB (NUDIX family)
MEHSSMPLVGLGVIILNSEGHILIGKRKGSHSPYYSIPGGKLEAGETFEDGAIREVKEETGLEIRDPKVIAVINNLRTYREEGLHFVSIALLVTDFSGQLEVVEPMKCEEWLWTDPKCLPSPHFEASRMAVQCFLERKFYVKN